MKKAPTIKYEKFICIDGGTMRRHIEKLFKAEFLKDFYVDDFVRKSDGEWIVHLKRNGSL